MIGRVYIAQRARARARARVHVFLRTHAGGVHARVVSGGEVSRVARVHMSVHMQAIKI